MTSDTVNALQWRLFKDSKFKSIRIRGDKIAIQVTVNLATLSIQK